MLRKILIPILLGFLATTSGWGQSNVSTGLLPRINASTKISEQVGLTGSIESRQVVLESLEDDLSYNYILTDISAVGSFRTGAKTKVNVGYTLRLLDNLAFHRFIQQLNLISRHEGFVLGHRFGTDQTFGQDAPAVYRIRYRIALEKPLQGLETDPKEFYLKVGNEYIVAFESGYRDIEIRLIPAAGYVFNPWNRIEAGIDYRFNEFLLSPSDHDFWFSLTWYASIGSRK